MTNLSWQALAACGLSLVTCVGCSREDERATSPTAQLAEAAGIAPAAVLPRFGGQPVIAGTRVVEVLPTASGEVEAEVRDAAGQPVANAQLSVSVQGGDGQPRSVPLRYDGNRGRYVGQAPQGTVIVPGPVQVDVRPRGGDPTVGRAPTIAVAPPPAHGGQVVIVGPQALEVRVGADRRVRAYVPTEDGELPDGELYASVPVQGGAPVRVELEYDDDEGCYVAELDEDATIVPGPFELELEVDDVVHRGRVAEITVAPRATLGGEVLVVGDYGVEVVPVDGELRATLYDRQGRPVDDRPPTVDVRVEGHPQPVRLRWNASLGYYVAPVPAGVVVATAPLQVEVRHHGRFHRGRLRVHPHTAHVVVAGPVAHVEVRPPAPRVDVRVHHPGVVVHVDDDHQHGKHRKHRKSRHRH